MNTKLFTGLALAAALLIGQPAFAHGNNRGGGKGGHAVAAAHHGGGGGRVASHGGRGGGNVRMAKVSTNRGFRGTRVASTRTFNGPRTAAATRGSGRSVRATPTVAYGGTSYNARNAGYGRSGNGNARYAFASHNGWSHDRDYDWDGHHYRWFNNAWFIVDPFPYEASYYPSSGYGPNSDSAAVQVQQDLAHDGYYQGPIDGVVGPGTRSAIAAYQQDNGMPPTGNINGALLNSLNGG